MHWLSRGKMPKRFWELIEEVIEFLRSKTNKDKEVVTMTDQAWQTDLTFVVDMTQHLNDLNLKLQGKNQLVCQLANHISTFRTKLQLFWQQAASRKFLYFPNLQLQIKYRDIDTNIYLEKLDALIQSFNSLFLDFDQGRLLMKLFADLSVYQWMICKGVPARTS